MNAAADFAEARRGLIELAPGFTSCAGFDLEEPDPNFRLVTP